MKELRFLSLACILLPALAGSLYNTNDEDSRLSRSAVEAKEQVLTTRAKRSHRHTHHEKENKSQQRSAIAKRSSSQKRQFLPFSLPFHSHPMFNRIIVHHHPGTSLMSFSLSLAKLPGLSLVHLPVWTATLCHTPCSCLVLCLHLSFLFCLGLHCLVISKPVLDQSSLNSRGQQLFLFM